MKWNELNKLIESYTVTWNQQEATSKCYRTLARLRNERTSENSAKLSLASLHSGRPPCHLAPSEWISRRMLRPFLCSSSELFGEWLSNDILKIILTVSFNFFQRRVLHVNILSRYSYDFEVVVASGDYSHPDVKCLEIFLNWLLRFRRNGRRCCD